MCNKKHSMYINVQCTRTSPCWHLELISHHSTSNLVSKRFESVEVWPNIRRFCHRRRWLSVHIISTTAHTAVLILRTCTLCNFEQWWLYVCVRACVCVYVSAVCVCVCMYACMCTCVCVTVCVCVYIIRPACIS